MNTGTREPAFAAKDVVQRINQPDAVGVIMDAHWSAQSESWTYRVQFGSQLKVVPEESLQAFVPVTSAWEAFRAGSFSGINHFIFTLTFHRLRRPPTRIAYSFATSRTHFYPHQFKPLLKFLDNAGKRLLIADDVGLGKTIEAGYILRELEARQGIERVLVIVPARLTTKWKRELQMRFERSFDVIGRQDLLKMTSRLRQGREPEPFNWIISYESARPDEVRTAIEETQPRIDVLIADEAHRMRNSESLQHRIGAALCRCADAVVFLSATPVQNRLEDLWHLLRLLSPGEFSEWTIFEDQIKANALLLKAQRALAQSPVDSDGAKESIKQFLRRRASSRLAGTEMVASVERRLEKFDLERRELLELQADISRLSPIAHILTRTRKAEALPNRPVRDAHWQRVELSAPERKIYESVESLCRSSWPGSNNSWGFQMSLLMAYRITASCIPAAMEYFSERLRVGAPQEPLSDLIEESEGEEPGEHTGDLDQWTKDYRERLAETVAWYEKTRGEDSKLKSFIEAAQSVWADDGKARRERRKIVVFSFFRRTLEYLARVLRERGISNRMIHGLIAVPDREAAIDDFLERDDVPVLLTSEVGGEGIDLQRASVVVNYDLPWNPMVVEQRIGRVDRIGQESERIVVFNLVVGDSIEERVLQRLFEKIGVFRESIGELDPIIGVQIERLSESAIRGALVGEELALQVEQTATALAAQVQAARQMLSQVDGLLAADQGLIDEIGAVTGERQIPSESDLLLFLNTFLAQNVPGAQIPQSAVRGVVPADLRGHLPSRLEAAAPSIGGDPSAFAHRIMSGPINLTLSRDVGYRHSKAELIHLRHPLVKYCVSETGHSAQKLARSFSIALPASKHLAPGLFAFVIASIEIGNHRPMSRFAAVVTDLEGKLLLSDPDLTTPIVLELLERGQDAEPVSILESQFDAVKTRLLNRLDSVISDWSSRERELAQARRQLQHAALVATLELRLQREQERLRTLTQRNAADFPIRMAHARLDKVRMELEAMANAAVLAPWDGFEQEEIAVGLVRVLDRESQ